MRVKSLCGFVSPVLATGSIDCSFVSVLDIGSIDCSVSAPSAAIISINFNATGLGEGSVCWAHEEPIPKDMEPIPKYFKPVPQPTVGRSVVPPELTPPGDGCLVIGIDLCFVCVCACQKFVQLRLPCFSHW